MVDTERVMDMVVPDYVMHLLTMRVTVILMIVEEDHQVSTTAAWHTRLHTIQITATAPTMIMKIHKVQLQTTQFIPIVVIKIQSI